MRASLVESNMLTRALGRPNREQVVTTRPAELTTLQALDLTNGDVLASQLQKATERMVAELGEKPDAKEIIRTAYREALSREPNEAEVATCTVLLTEEITPETLADLYWSIMMLPEFQMVR